MKSTTHVLETLYQYSFSHSSALPIVTASSVDSTEHYPAGSNISIQCTWSIPVYYVAWYRNVDLISEEDLAAPSLLMGPPQGTTVNSDYSMMTSTLTIAGAATGDSSSYICAVTCGARGEVFGSIPSSLLSSAMVSVYGE